MEHFNVNYALTLPVAGIICFRVRLPVRPAGAAAVRGLSGAGDLRAGDRDAAAVEARRVRALDRRRAGPGRDQARRAVRPADGAGHVAVLFHAGGRYRDLCLLGQSAESRSGRAIMAIRDNEIAASAMGVNVALYKTLAFGVCAGITGVAGGARRHRGAVRGARQLHHHAGDLAVPRHGGRRRRLAARLVVGSAFIIFVPNIAEAFPRVSPAPCSACCCSS